MIDIHSHIIYNVDDGSKSLKESLDILTDAESEGVTDIILTPHYINGSRYDATLSTLRERLETLKKRAQEIGINVNLYLGNEAFIEYNLKELLEENKFTTLNGSRYLLFEFSMDNFYQGIYDLLFSFRNSGIVLIVAHPERYSFIQENPLLLNELLKHGALLQLDVGSFFGKYGKQAKRVANLIMKHKMASFIATDIHHSYDNFYEQLRIIYEKYLKTCSEQLLVENPRKVINNELIEKKEYSEIKKTLFKRFK